MANTFLPTINYWALWSQLDIIPLSILPDGDASTPEISLVGELTSGGSYGYGLKLSASLEYRFEEPNSINRPSERAMLVDPVSGEVLWANAKAQEPLSSLAFDPSQPLLLSNERNLVLVVSDDGNLSSSTTFELEIFADTPSVHATTEDPVYRFAKLSTGSYFYTASIEERDQIVANNLDFRFEGVVFFGDTEARDDFVAVRRFANLQSGSYFYTANSTEIELSTNDPKFRDEGIAFYAATSDSPETSPVYRLQNPRSGGYLFTSNPAEKAYALLDGWSDQGVAFYSESPGMVLEVPSNELPAVDLFAA